ncbi:putative ATP synthase, F0 complex, subunit D [Helianthus annuus]|nr:putative ATP synthase, F0 complex, subunit D [Helianthus annuus]
MFIIVSVTFNTKFYWDHCVEIPKFVDKTTPEYKPKFDALLVELKEAEQKSLKESERLEKEIADVQELKKKLSTMTADEYFEKHPELKQNLKKKKKKKKKKKDSRSSREKKKKKTEKKKKKKKKTMVQKVIFSNYKLGSYSRCIF